MLTKVQEYEVQIDRLRLYDGGPDFSDAYHEGAVTVRFNGVCIMHHSEEQPWDREDLCRRVAAIIMTHAAHALCYWQPARLESEVFDTLRKWYTRQIFDFQATSYVDCYLGTDTPQVYVTDYSNDSLRQPR